MIVLGHLRASFFVELGRKRGFEGLHVFCPLHCRTLGVHKVHSDGEIASINGLDMLVVLEEILTLFALMTWKPTAFVPFHLPCDIENIA